MSKTELSLPISDCPSDCPIRYYCGQLPKVVTRDGEISIEELPDHQIDEIQTALRDCVQAIRSNGTNVIHCMNSNEDCTMRSIRRFGIGDTKKVSSA